MFAALTALPYSGRRSIMIPLAKLQIEVNNINTRNLQSHHP
jgi:hypothetical protein